MEHIKTKKHVLKKVGGFLLLTAVILGLGDLSGKACSA